MVFATVLAAATFFLVLFQTDPATAGVFGFSLFYLSLGFALCGVVSIAGFLVRVLLHRDEILSRLVGLSFRQAVLLCTLAVIALMLHARDLLSWWNSALLVIVVTIIEFIFISIEKKPAHDAQ
jgi:hypothetical protein